jgi:predicted ATP-binding protein involved in virulence
MLRLFGLLFCILLTLVFPFLAYEMNDGIIVDSIASTTVFFAIIIALFPGSNFNTKTQKKCVVLVGDDQTVCDREATNPYFCEVESQSGKIVREKLHVCNRHKEVFEERYNEQDESMCDDGERLT